MDQLPEDTDDVKDVENLGIKVVFNQLPPHLKPRLSYDPLAKKLIFKGIFIEPALGDPFILPNVLTDTEFNFLTTEFSTDPNWVSAIENLPRPGDTFANTLFLKASEFADDVEGETVCAPIESIDDTDPIIKLTTPQGTLRIFNDGATSIHNADDGDAEITLFDDVRSESFSDACVSPPQIPLSVIRLVKQRGCPQPEQLKVISH